jgi:hypothetical protein
VPFNELSAREVLLELGLAGIEDSAEAQRCLDAFMAVLEVRVGRRLSMVLGPSIAAAISNAPESEARTSFELLQSSLPEYEQYLEDEFERLKVEFGARLEERLATEATQATISTP